MSGQEKHYNVLHICDYSAHYRGNFVDSLESLQRYHPNVTNFFLFPTKARNTGARQWIGEMNREKQVAYIQEESLVRNVRLLSRILKEHQIHRVVRHFTDSRMDVMLFFLFGGKKVIRFFHNGYDPKDRSLKHHIRRFFWRNNRLVGVSAHATRDLKQAMPDFQVTPIVNAISFERLEQGEPIEKPEKISMLMMGWDYWGKGVDLAVKACLALRERYDFVLRIVGLDNEAKIRALVREIAGEEADWVRFLPPTNQIGTYYRANDIFLSPSRHEAFGYANVEAAYCENSIVLSKVDGQGELRIDGAYWFDSENVEDFARQLETAILDRKDPDKIAQRARTKERISIIYSLETWSDKLMELITQD